MHSGRLSGGSVMKIDYKKLTIDRYYWLLYEFGCSTYWEPALYGGGRGKNWTPLGIECDPDAILAVGDEIPIPPQPDGFAGEKVYKRGVYRVRCDDQSEVATTYSGRSWQVVGSSKLYRQHDFTEIGEYLGPLEASSKATCDRPREPVNDSVSAWIQQKDAEIAKLQAENRSLTALLVEERGAAKQAFELAVMLNQERAEVERLSDILGRQCDHIDCLAGQLDPPEVWEWFTADAAAWWGENMEKCCERWDAQQDGKSKSN